MQTPLENRMNVPTFDDPTFGDFYSTRPGDEISRTTSTRRRRTRRIWIEIFLIALGAFLIIFGFYSAVLGKEKELAQPRPAPRPVRPQQPVEAPETSAILETPAPVTPATLQPTTTPTDSSLFALLSDSLGRQALLDEESISYASYKWLLTNENLDQYDNMKLKTRFALAALYFATNGYGNWEIDDGWLSDDDECTWYGIECTIGHLTSLNMTSNGLTGLIPDEITLLSETLLDLLLGKNDLLNSNEELAWLGELTNLSKYCWTSLIISKLLTKMCPFFCSGMLEVYGTSFAFDGLPTYLSNLTELRILDVSNTLFYGELDGSIFAPLQKLVYLDLGGNWYNCTIPNEMYELPELEALYVYESGLEGDINGVPKMTSIFELWIEENNVVGPIPGDIGKLTGLASLSLSNNDLTGQIPSEIGNLSLMRQMWLHGNWFTGTIPSEIGKLSQLQILGLEDNSITHTSMPDEVCDLDMISLSGDCQGDWGLECECCTCCEPPCPAVTLPVYDVRRRLRELRSLD